MAAFWWAHGTDVQSEPVARATSSGMDSRTRQHRLRRMVTQLPSPDLLVPLPANPTGPALARQHALRCLEELGLSTAATDVSLIVSELVTNAVLHGTPPIELMLSRSDGHLRIEVCDGSDDTSLVSAHPRSDGRARGLHIVDELSESWGSAARPQGKVVWAEYRLSPD